MSTCERCRELGETCPDCRTQSLLGGLGRALERWDPPPVALPASVPSRRPAWAAAAAVLLVALVAFWRFHAAPPVSAPRPAAPVLRAAAGESLQAGPEGLQAVWEEGASAHLRPGARVRVFERGMRLLSGAVRARGLERIETDRGFVRALRQPMECLVEAEGAQASLLREAWAAGEPRVTLLSGEAEWVDRGGLASRIQPASRPAVAEPALVLDHASALPSGGWRMTPGPARAAVSGRLPGRVSGFVWEAEVRPGPKSTLAVMFRSGGALRQWILTSRAARLRLQVCAGRIWAEADGIPAWSCPADSPTLARFPDEGVEGDLGLVAWGDDVDLLSFRLEPVTAPVVLVGAAR